MDWESTSTVNSNENSLSESKGIISDDDDDLLDISVIRCDKETDLISKLLNDKTMGIHTKNARNETMLHFAAKNGMEKLVSLLIEKLMKSTKNLENVIDKDGMSTFHVLCMGPNSDYVKKFLDLGLVSDTNCAVSCKRKLYCDGYSPVHFAAEYYRLNTLKILIEHGAVVKARHFNDLTPILLVCKQNTERLIYQAMEDMNSDDFYDNYRTLVNNRIEMIDLLLKNDCDIDNLHLCAALGHIVKKQVYNLNSYIAYCKGICYHQYDEKLNDYSKNESNIVDCNKYGRSEMIKLILNRTERDEGFTALHWLAANFGPEVYDENIIEIVIENLDGNANATDENLCTPLHVSAKLNNRDFMKQLFYLDWAALNWEKHVDIDAQDNEGNTALHYVCSALFNSEEQYESMTLLLNNGADFTIPNKQGVTVLSVINDALENATDRELKDVIEYYVVTANDRLMIHRLDDWLNNTFTVLVISIWGHLERRMILSHRPIIDETNYSRLFRLYEIFHSFAPFFFFKFTTRCEKDIAKLKNLHFGKSFTLYDVLVKDTYQIAFYTENDELKNSLNLYDENLCNSMYRGLMKARFIKICMKKRILDEAKVAFTAVTDKDIPEPCLERIFYYLINDDLRSLIKACK